MTYFFTLCFALNCVAQVTFNSSQIPVIEIITKNNPIQENGKVLASMRVFDRKDGLENKLSDTPTFTTTIGIEYRGQTSFFLSDKKPFNVEIRNQDGTLEVEAPLLGLPKDSDWAFLAPYSDKTLVREAFMYRVAQQMLPFSPRFRFVEIILNGAYIGIYMVTDKMNRGKNRIDVDKMETIDIAGDELTGGYIFALDKTKQGDKFFYSSVPYPVVGGRKPEYVIVYPKAKNLQTAQKNYITSWVHKFESMMSKSTFSDPLTGYETYLDVPSFVDYVLLQELSKNVDGYRLSNYFAKDKDSKNPKMRVASIWDFNIAMDNANYCSKHPYKGWAYDFNVQCPDDNWLIHGWMLKILADQKFKLLLKKRWQTLRQTTLTEPRLMATIDSLSNTIGTDAVARNFKKYPILNQLVWPNPSQYGTHFGEVKYLKLWLRDRILWLDAAFATITDTILPDIEKKIALYPNPVENSINIDFSTIYNGSEVTFLVYNTQGQLVLQSSKFYNTIGTQYMNIDCAQLPKGIYFYQLKATGNDRSGKFVK